MYILFYIFGFNIDLFHVMYWRGIKSIYIKWILADKIKNKNEDNIIEIDFL